jgi:hypothetical protein
LAGRQDFTPVEWQLLHQAATYAGLIVAAAQRGGFFWEAVSIARTFTQTRTQHSDSRLLDDLVAERPQVERTQFRSADEVREHGLQHIRAAMAIVRQKGDPVDIDAYARFLADTAENVARAYRETNEPITQPETTALAEIRAAVELPTHSA